MIPKVVLLVVLLIVTVYLSFGPQELDKQAQSVKPIKKYHIDYGYNISVLLDVKLPDNVLSKDVNVEIN